MNMREAQPADLDAFRPVFGDNARQGESCDHPTTGFADAYEMSQWLAGDDAT